MLIHISQNDINNGIPRSPTACPVALALYRATQEGWVVGGTKATGLGSVHDLPTKVQKWIRRFDQGLAVAPCTIKIV